MTLTPVLCSHPVIFTLVYNYFAAEHRFETNPISAVSLCWTEHTKNRKAQIFSFILTQFFQSNSSGLAVCYQLILWPFWFGVNKVQCIMHAQQLASKINWICTAPPVRSKRHFPWQEKEEKELMNVTERWLIWGDTPSAFRPCRISLS